MEGKVGLLTDFVPFFGQLVSSRFSSLGLGLPVG
jgi:hypothetical protein